MLDLARILAAVSAVSEGRAPTDTAKTAPEQAVSAVSVVTAENNKDAQHTAPDDQGAAAEHESLSRTLISNRYNRYNRYTSNDAGSGVSATKAATDTTDTERRAVAALAATKLSVVWNIPLVGNSKHCLTSNSKHRFT